MSAIHSVVPFFLVACSWLALLDISMCQLQGRSSFSGPADGNAVRNLYEAFPMPQVRPNYEGMNNNWFQPPAFQPAAVGPQNQLPMGPSAPYASQELPQLPVEPKRPNDGSIQVSDLKCQRDRSVIGLSNDRNHWLSTVECECRPSDGGKLEYYCYSLCDGPQLNQRCVASFSILNSCPTYSKCGNWSQTNDTTSGAISCVTASPVPEAVCWILASAVLRSDNRPLRPAFYAAASGGCHMSCLCGNDGTVAGEFQCSNAASSNWRFPVYPRNHKFTFDQPA